MDLVLYVVVVLIVVGFCLWLFNRYVAPIMSPPFPQIINIVVIVVACLWLLTLLFHAYPLRH